MLTDKQTRGWVWTIILLIACFITLWVLKPDPKTWDHIPAYGERR